MIPSWLRGGKTLGGDLCRVTKRVGVVSRGRTCSFFFFSFRKSSFPSPNPHQAQLNTLSFLCLFSP